MSRYDWLVVGAGFAGSVMAERLASQLGQRVLLIDRRDHVGGNAYDHPDASGVIVHRYGPHIFHTNSKSVVDYLSSFTEWRPYEHRVLARVRDRLVPIPINRTTINELFGTGFVDDEAVAEFYAGRAESVGVPRTSEDVVVGTVGRELYELFFQGYTRKQWGLDPSQLDASVTARIPTRTNEDDRYFNDEYQAMPRDGFTHLFERMLDHPRISVRTGTDMRDVSPRLYRGLVYTGPIDAYFGHRFGPLPYRSLEFQFETLDKPLAQPVATINEPCESVPYTRTTEFKHLTGQRHARTTIVREFPTADGDPFYPIPRPENRALYQRYELLAAATTDVHFIGRLATYKYYNMDQVVAQALATFKKIAGGASQAA
ncbi:MAG TPA: UDP-galactopyranose mutase [Candidatus Limnocylindrales bacterium]|nr:UDP-galactopyranose mutase [Candidatus Limnocylindrales bacterium]